MIHQLVAALATLLDGLMAGVMLGSALVEHSAKALPAESWIRYKQAKERTFGPAMPPLLLAAILASGVAGLFAGLPGFLVAALLLLVLLAITAGVHIPLNREIDRFDPAAAPGGWAGARNRWRRWNWMRCGAAVLAFVVAVIGVMRPT